MEVNGEEREIRRRVEGKDKGSGDKAQFERQVDACIQAEAER